MHAPSIKGAHTHANTGDLADAFYTRYAVFYEQCLVRIQDVLAEVGNTAALEPMERSATCKEALARIAFLAESTPTTADLRAAELGDGDGAP